MGWGFPPLVSPPPGLARGPPIEPRLPPGLGVVRLAVTILRALVGTERTTRHFGSKT